MDLLEGTFAVQLARQAVEEWTLKGQRLALKQVPSQFKEKSGAFVTLITYPENELRGCIGYIEPQYPLAVAIISAGIHACSDPRFERLQAEELERVRLEVSVLTKPELLEVKDPKKDYEKKIVIGRDGLIVQRGLFKGVLLPQVATNHSLDVRDFLMETCLKAGLPPTAWHEPKTRVYRFRSEIFEEKSPRGEVMEKKLSSEKPEA